MISSTAAQNAYLAAVTSSAGHAERLGVAVDVAEEAGHVVGEGGLVVRAAAVLQQEQGIEALVHQVDEGAGALPAAPRLPAGRGAPFDVGFMLRSQSVRV
jgi:hypothetical protein